MGMSFAKTTAALILGSRGVVGTAGRCAGLGGSVPVLILDGVGDFPSRSTLREYNGLDLEWLPGNNPNTLTGP